MIPVINLRRYVDEIEENERKSRVDVSELERLLSHFDDIEANDATRAIFQQLVNGEFTVKEAEGALWVYRNSRPKYPERAP